MNHRSQSLNPAQWIIFALALGLVLASPRFIMHNPYYH